MAAKQLLRLAHKEGPGHNLVVSLDDDDNVVLAEEDTGEVFFRLLPESLEKMYKAVMAEGHRLTDDKILFVDSDLVFPSDALDRLITRKLS